MVKVAFNINDSRLECKGKFSAAVLNQRRYVEDSDAKKTGSGIDYPLPV